MLVSPVWSQDDPCGSLPSWDSLWLCDSMNLRKIIMRVYNMWKIQSQELHFGGKAKLERMGQREAIRNFSMVGEKKKRQC